jgi:hypothetical protein
MSFRRNLVFKWLTMTCFRVQKVDASYRDVWQPHAGQEKVNNLAGTCDFVNESTWIEK